MNAAPGERPTADACTGCDRSTAPGGPLFSDRRQYEVPGGCTYLCADCHATLRAPRAERSLSEDEVRQAVENGSAVGLLWGGGPGIG